MADHNWPSGRLYCPARLSIYPLTFGYSSVSQVSGDSQGRPTVGWFWKGSLALIPATHDERAGVEALLNSWRHGDRMIFGYLGRKKRGTITGAVTVVGSHAAGARQIAIAGTNGQTVKAGDMFSGGTGFYMVLADAVLSGTTTIYLSTSLIAPLTNGAALNFDTPTTKWARLSAPQTVYLPGYSPGIEIDIEERRD